MMGRPVRSKHGGAKRRRGRRRPAPAADDVPGQLRAVEEQGFRKEFAHSRDTMAAMIAVRAIERATELASVEEGGLALRRALRKAQEPLAAFIEREARKAVRASRPKRRKKA